jgi:hypothetical protein
MLMFIPETTSTWYVPLEVDARVLDPVNPGRSSTFSSFAEPKAAMP